MSDSLRTTLNDQGKRFSIVGPGRAGLSMMKALSSSGWSCVNVFGRGDSLTEAASGVDVLVIAVPDHVIGSVAAAITPLHDTPLHDTPADSAPSMGTVICHMSGSRTLAELAPHNKVGSIHPLMSLPDPDVGSFRLLDKCTFAVCGSNSMNDLVKDLGGTAITIKDEDRALYHAAASVSANHLVALVAQVERLAAQVGVPAEAFFKLMATTFENATELGAKAALTGPAARGDWATIEAHLNALDNSEHATYLALAQSAATLADQSWPDNLPKETSQ